MKVNDIVKQWLKKSGYDGLCCVGCGCGLDDLMPCCGDYSGGDYSDCVPAKKKIATKEDIDEFSEFAVGDEIFVPAEVE